MARLVRAQALPLDFIAGLFIFLLLLAYFLALWDIFAIRYGEQSSRNSAELSAILLSDQLIGSGGMPENWTQNANGTGMVGIARVPGQIDHAKLSALQAMPYEDAKRLMGISHDFFIKVEDSDGVLYSLFGQEPEARQRAVEVTRIASLNGTTVFLRVQLYE